MRKFLPLLIAFIFIFLLKLSNLGIRISDTNIYFYTAYKLLQDDLLYKDIFFTNLPLFPYLASLYFIFLNGNLNLFFLTPTLEVITISTLIYFIVSNKTKNYLLALCSSVLYMFSFLVLSTSDHQTGVFLASIFSLISYIFLEKRRFLLSGMFIAFALLTKAYFLPILISFFLSIIKDKRGTVKFLISFLLNFFIILLPFLILSRNEFITDVFKYSLTRSAGLLKSEIVWFFIIHDFIFFMLLIFNLINIKKQLFWGSFSLFSILFFIFYSDIYYLYLNFLAPFLALSFVNFHTFVQRKFNFQPMVIPTFIFIFSIFNIIIYLSSYKNLQKIPNINELVKIIKQEKPNYLYGVNDTTPALAYLTNTPLLENIVDTNENIFRKKFLDANLLTKKAISSKTILVAHGASYPQINVSENILDGIFNNEEVEKHCKLISSFPVQSEGVINRLTLLKCSPSQPINQDVKSDSINPETLAKAVKAIDGDTIEIENGKKVRYIGIDTPETVDPRKTVECFGKKAAAKNKELVEGKIVKLIKDVSETDKYGRLLRYVWVKDLFINDYLVGQGFATVATFPPDVRYQKQFLKAQNEAKEKNLGLWSFCK